MALALTLNIALWIHIGRIDTDTLTLSLSRFITYISIAHS